MYSRAAHVYTSTVTQPRCRLPSLGALGLGPREVGEAYGEVTKQD